MRRIVRIAAVFALIALTGAASSPEPPQTTVAKPAPGFANGNDPFLWLEDKDGARAMAWVRKQNARSLPVLERDPHYTTFYAQALKINQSTQRIPYPTTLRGEIYNFWQDATHIRGIWRKTTLESYRTSNPQWTTVLDLDALSKREHANWVFKGYDCIEPREDRCMLLLSDGGEDAVTAREFSLTTNRFVSGGFALPRQKQDLAWLDENTLLVSRAWQPNEVTPSGYAYDVRVLKRGEPLTAATEFYKGRQSDVSVRPFTIVDGYGHTASFVERGITFFTSEEYLLTPKGLKKLNLPQKIEIEGLVKNELLIKLDQNWSAAGKSFTQGSLIEVPLSAAFTNPANLSPKLVYAPSPREALEGVATTKNDLIVTLLHNVRGRAYVYTPALRARGRGARFNFPTSRRWAWSIRICRTTACSST